MGEKHNPANIENIFFERPSTNDLYLRKMGVSPTLYSNVHKKHSHRKLK